MHTIIYAHYKYTLCIHIYVYLHKYVYACHIYWGGYMYIYVKPRIYMCI